MDPLQALMQATVLAQQGGAPREHPLARAFGGTPMYGGVPVLSSQMFDLSGIPGFQGNTPTGMMMGMLLQNIMPQLMGPNYTSGQFAPTQNWYDHRYAVRYFMDRRRAGSIAGQSDIDTYYRLARGMGMQDVSSARRMAQDMGNVIAPIVSDLFPELMDRMHGVRGSAYLMGQRMFEGGRYTLDPITGRLGMSAESAGAVTSEVFSQLYGSGADISRMRGLGAGRAGQMYDEMVRRGFAPTASFDPQEARTRLQQELSRNPEEIRSASLRSLRRQLLGDRQGETDGMSPERVSAQLGTALSELERANPQALDAAMRSFNATRVSQSIQSMAGAVRAMRDIFGDMGRPDAPMVEIFNGLQSLTQNGMSRLAPAQLERIARETYSVAKSTGLGLEQLMGMMGTSAQHLDQIGGPRNMANAVARGTALFGSAYGLADLGPGAMDREAAAQLDLRLRGQAASSPQAVRLAGFMRLADTFRRGNNQVGFAPNTEAFALAEAIRSEQSTYVFGGQQRFVTQSAPELLGILTRAGVNPNEAAQIMTMSPRAVAEYLERYEQITDITRESQGRLDVERPVSQVLTNAFGASFANVPGMDGRRRAQVASALGASLFQEYQALSDSNPALFEPGRQADLNMELAKRLRRRLGNQLSGISTARLTNAIGSALSVGDNFVAGNGSRFANAQNMRGLATINSQRVFQLQRQLRAETRTIASFQSALSRVGTQDLIPRLSDFIQEAGEGGSTSFRDLVARISGGIPNREMESALAPLIEHIATLERQSQDAGRQFGTNSDQFRIMRDRVNEEVNRLFPDINAIFQEGGAARLSPEARQIIRRRGGSGALGRELPVEVRQLQDLANREQRALHTVREQNIEGRAPVRQARQASAAAQTNLENARAAMEQVMNTPAVQAARRDVAATQTALADVTRQMETAFAPNSAATEEQRNALVSRRDELRNQLGQQQGELTRAEATVRSSDAGQAAQTGLRRAEEAAQKAQNDLIEARRRAGADADNDPEVRAQQARVDAQFAALNQAQRRNNLPETRPQTPEQLRLTEARRQYSTAVSAARTAMLADGRLPESYGRARTAYTNARTALQEADNRYRAAVDTPRVVERREAFSKATRRLTSIDSQLARALRTGDAAKAQQLQRQRAAAIQEVNKTRERWMSSRAQAERAPGVAALREARDQAQTRFTQAQTNLREEDARVRPLIEADPEVARLRAARDQAAELAGEQPRAQQGIPPGGPPPAGGPNLPGQPPGGVGGPARPGAPPTPPGRPVADGTPGNISGGTLNVTGQTIRFQDARVELNARELRLPASLAQVQTANIATTERRDGEFIGEQVQAGHRAAQRITGTLRLEGLEQAVLEATAAGASNDPRSLV